MIQVLLLSLTLLVSIGWHSERVPIDKGYPSKSQNQPPKVIIESPLEKQTIAPGEQIIYSIVVEDQEDGSSKYQEIADNEVFIELKYFSGSHNNPTVQYKSQHQSRGLQLIKSSDCFDCHQWKTGLVGPSFQAIANKYHPTESSQLATSITKGSSGKWGNELMPSQETLDQSLAEGIVSWLLTHGKDQTLEVKRGLNGKISVAPETKPGYLILTAAYTDHGSANHGSLTGEAGLVIRVEPD